MGRPHTQEYLNSFIGKRFNQLTILGVCKRNKGNVNHFYCQCDCGRTQYVSVSRILHNQQQTCGRFHRKYENQEVGTRLYNTWNRMIHRCYDPNYHKYPSYGARGISVCDEWRNDYDTFYRWAIENGYQLGLWIERIDNDGNYCPENCKWATRKEQMNNTRRNHFIEYNGETKTLAEWSDVLGINYSTLHNRITRWGNVQKAFGTPVGSTH